MTKIITNSGRWKSGQSGNPKGRPRKQDSLSQLLRLEGDATLIIGDEVLSAREALAKIVWQLAINGEVWLGGKRLETKSVTEWVSVVRWLYDRLELPDTIEMEQAPEMIVRVLREDKAPLDGSLAELVAEESAEENLYGRD